MKELNDRLDPLLEKRLAQLTSVPPRDPEKGAPII